MNQIKIRDQLDNQQLTLTLLMMEDANDIYQAILASQTALSAFPASLPWALFKPSMQSTLEYCRKHKLAIQQQIAFHYVIRLKVSHQFVGMIGIQQIRWDIPSITLSFWGNISFKGQGYMTQALQLFIEYLRTDVKVKRIDAFVDMENESAKRLCLRTNFILEEVMEHAARHPIDSSLRNIGVYVVVC